MMTFQKLTTLSSIISMFLTVSARDDKGEVPRSVVVRPDEARSTTTPLFVLFTNLSSTL